MGGKMNLSIYEILNLETVWVIYNQKIFQGKPSREWEGSIIILLENGLILKRKVTKIYESEKEALEALEAK